MFAPDTWSIDHETLPLKQNSPPKSALPQPKQWVWLRFGHTSATRSVVVCRDDLSLWWRDFIRQVVHHLRGHLHFWSFLCQSSMCGTFWRNVYHPMIVHITSLKTARDIFCRFEEPPSVRTTALGLYPHLFTTIFAGYQSSALHRRTPRQSDELSANEGARRHQHYSDKGYLMVPVSRVPVLFSFNSFSESLHCTQTKLFHPK